MDKRLLVGCIGIINLVYSFQNIQLSTIFKQRMDLTYRPFLQIFPKASAEAEDLLRRLLHFNPYKRLTAEVIILNLYNHIVKCFINDVLYRSTLYKSHFVAIGALPTWHRFGVWQHESIQNLLRNDKEPVATTCEACIETYYILSCKRLNCMLIK